MTSDFARTFSTATLAAALILLIPAGVRAQSLWTDQSTSMVADNRAHAVGDILTILVQEDSSSSKANNTSTSKSTGVDASISSFLYAPGASGLLTKGGQMPAVKFDAKNDFAGGGKINNSEKITARIAVRVVDVLPNGNLVIEGVRRTSFSGETMDAILRGVVRSQDITASNLVYSYNIADASIRYVSTGVVTDNQKRGWFKKVWDKVSPF